MASDRWTPTTPPGKGDKYEWRFPNNENQHGEQTTGAGDLLIQPEHLALAPTNSPTRSGVQWGQDAWNYTDSTPDQSWYVIGSDVE